MNRIIAWLSILVLLIASVHVTAQKKVTARQAHFAEMAGSPMATLVNINNISMWIEADGRSARNPLTGDEGTFFPRGTAPIVGSDGFVWGGVVKDGRAPEIRVGGQAFSSGTKPGRIISKGLAEDPDAGSTRIWRIRRDWRTADLAQDASEILNLSVDALHREQIDAVRSQYERDWNEWPWEKGAPFYDDNNNGIMDEGEDPGLAFADQVVWFVANDLDSVATSNFPGSPPIGLEMQVTLWAYKARTFNRTQILQNSIFKRYRWIYKGTSTSADTSHIDSMYVAQWAEPDVGAFSDDLAGCDTTLQIGFAYNWKANDALYSTFNLSPAAVGYALLQGPIVPSKKLHSRATFNSSRRIGYENLPLYFFWHNASGDHHSMPGGPLGWYLLLRGYYEFSDPNNPTPYAPVNGEPTKFPFSGDPVTGQGAIDGAPGGPGGGNRMFAMSTGPFTLALGDTQEVIIGLVAGLGSGRLASVSVMKRNVKWAQLAYLSNFGFGFEEHRDPVPEEPVPDSYRLHQNFPNPFNPSTEIGYDLPVETKVNLTIYNVLGQRVKTLVDETQEAGAYSLLWNGTNERGELVPSGVYFYQITVGLVKLSRKMILVR